MIELKPYRGTIPSTAEKGDKTSLGGELREGKQAYPWYEHPSLMGIAGGLFIVGMLITFILATLTSTGIWCILFPMAYIASLYVMSILWQNYLSHHMGIGQPTLLISSERAARGDTLEMEFRQPFARDCIITSLSIDFISREWVRYKCGTKDCTDTRDKVIQSLHNQNKEQVASGNYEQRATFHIPSDAMHSLALPDNHLLWLIRVKLEVKDFMPLTETYAIQVTPEVHTL
jgi:hypothetical protein